MAEWRFDSRSFADARRLRHEFMAVLHDGGAGDFAAAELVYGELVGNAIRHAPGCIVIRLVWDGDTALLTVHDQGTSFRPKPVGLPPDPLSEGGRGLFLVKSLALDFRVQDIAGDGSQVLARLPVHRAA